MNRTVIIRGSFNNIVNILDKMIDDVDEKGSLFVIFNTEYDKFNNVSHDVFDIIKLGIDSGLSYVNTIVYPVKNFQNASFVDNVSYIVWFAKNSSLMVFNKDRIREKHIWKDVEWGKREKNYNKKGKDPGNVWIPTLDDGKAHITEHILLDEDTIIEKLLLMTECKNSFRYENTEVNKSKNILNMSNTKYGKIKKYNKTSKIYFQSSENMSCLKDSSCKTIVTSPPYWDLKNYYKKGQIGQEKYDMYISRLKKVWDECYRVLSKSGILWININIRRRNGETILIPYDIVKTCKDIGFNYKGIIVWHKSSGIPTSKNNLSDHHEYILVFSKSNNSKLNISIMSEFNDYLNEDISGKAFWNMNRKAGSVGKKNIHPAIFPNELALRAILSSSDQGDCVMDPFLGSGTTCIAANLAKRNFVGFEYNEGFSDLIKERIDNEIPDTDYEFIYNDK